MFTPIELFQLNAQEVERNTALRHIRKLEGEPPARAEIRVERGGPRLYLNGEEIYPLLALSTHLYNTIENFKEAGLHIYNPIIGTRSMWLGPDRYDWSRVDAFLDRLLELNPGAFFMPRLQLNTPTWWKEAHPEEMIKYGLDTPEKRHNILKHQDFPLTEGGHYFGTGNELWEASLASELWRRDTAAMLRAYLKHIEESPLRSRMMGYMPTAGRTGEWNYYGANFLPDYSEPMRRACGEIPDVKARLKTTFGLLRDPEKEKAVIQFYQKFHETVAENPVIMCRAVHEETKGRVLAGVFYGYLLEQVRIQDGGYLAAQKIFDSPDIDYIVGPYTYQPGNVRDEKGVPITMEDGAGNVLGSARGVAGDGGFRMMTESLRRRGKLYISEMDPSTYLDENPHRVIGGHGGIGSDTLQGSQRILRRDLGQVFASGVGGWLYDFGPLNKAKDGWYSGEEMIAEMKRFADLGKRRKHLDIAPVSQIAALCDAKTFAATEHWDADRPWEHYGIRYSDFINQWFINSQARAYHRIGAPMDFLFHFDLQPQDRERYRLLFMMNLYYLTQEEVHRLKTALHNSGMTVVWYYAPGFVAPEKLDLGRMESLTGFRFEILDSPGSMLIRSEIDALKVQFGVKRSKRPRFAVTDEESRPLGYWTDTGEVAFAIKEYEGYTSVYVGSAPLPQQLLRWLAGKAGADLWSSEPDIVRATRDAAALVATSDGGRTLTLPEPMAPVDGGPAQREHLLDLETGEVRIFAAET
ncbi:MAG: hypothetical protein KAJ12_10305 [Bacteroidetes bacterium]|nr:hypothetical protein [Bacteroidota bacterium]